MKTASEKLRTWARAKRKKIKSQQMHRDKGESIHRYERVNKRKNGAFGGSRRPMFIKPTQPKEGP